jgi:glycosyltransferase involved in cell wall biosynthesis
MSLGGPQVSVVISSYNRAESLRVALASLARQTFPGPHEVVVIDNNSTDSTRKVVETLIADGFPNLRYVFEPRQGASYGRNTGVQAAKAPIIAFTDDDLHVTPEWLLTVYTALVEHPEVEYVGGKVLPSSLAGWPSWVTREHWAPLALFDYGDRRFYVNPSRAVCLGTSNSAYRRSVFERVGYFDTRVQTAKRKSATEDHELQLRIWRSGGQGLWVPEAVVLSEVAPDRLTKAYHRRWQTRNGHYLAIMRDEAIEQTRAGRLFGVPGHIYRKAIVGAAGILSRLLRGDLDRAFAHEVQLRWALGFIGTRWRDYFGNFFTTEGRHLDRA